MPAKRFSLSTLTIALLFAAFTVAAAQTSVPKPIVYDAAAADANPLAQGWQGVEVDAAGSGFGAADDPINAGFAPSDGPAAWRIADTYGEPSLDFPHYKYPLAQTTVDAMYLGGWELTMRVRLIDVADGVQIGFHLGGATLDNPFEPDVTELYRIVLAGGGEKTLKIWVGGQKDFLDTGFPGDGFHDVTLRGKPAEPRFDVWIDGKKILNRVPPYRGFLPMSHDSVWFGSNSSPDANNIFDIASLKLTVTDPAPFEAIARENPADPAAAVRAKVRQVQVQRDRALGILRPDVRKIWDAAPHCAFTDLVRWRDRFYCTFREGSGHVPGADGTDGAIRIIASDDGDRWESVGLLKTGGVDLRDPKLSIMPDDRLMVLMGGSDYDGANLLGQLPRVSFLDRPGGAFTEPAPIAVDEKIASPFDWLWRVAWHEGVGYGVIYNRDQWGLHLVKTTDGIHYEWVQSFKLADDPNETTVRFDPEGRMWLVVRAEAGRPHGYLGVADPPYKDWKWVEIDQRLGGPDFLRLEEGPWLIGTRHYIDEVSTILGRLDADGHVEILAKLPSGGDTSYPGMLIHGGQLWVSYYSSHEGKTSIYLARLPLEELRSALAKER